MASKSIILNGEQISYQLVRRARRTVGLKITTDGLIVHAPKHISEAALSKLIQQKSKWIISKLAAREESTITPVHWQNGETLRLLDNDIVLNIEYDAKNKQVQFNHDSLIIAIPDVSDTALIQRKVTQWYKKQALIDFGRRLEIFAAKLNVSTPPLKLSSARTRWGSCSSRGDIRINWRLLQAPPHLINYVICHELAHLKEMNHSTKFWAVVASIYPDYKAAEKTLKQIGASLYRI